LAFTYAQNNQLDAELRAEAVAVAAQVTVDNSHVSYVGGDLPHETPAGLAVDIAVVREDRVLASTPDQPLSNALLQRLAAGARGSGPASSSSELVVVAGEIRRAFATPIPSTPGVVLVASTPTMQIGSSVARAMVLVVVL